MDNNTLKILTFYLNKQIFGIDIADVSDIMPAAPVTPVPQSGGKISGLLNLRGHIVTCLLLRNCLGFSTHEADEMNIVVHDPVTHELYGFLCENIGDIRELDSTEMEAVPSILDQRWRGLSAGLFRQPDGLLILLDTKQVIDSSSPLAMIEAAI